MSMWWRDRSLYDLGMCLVLLAMVLGLSSVLGNIVGTPVMMRAAGACKDGATLSVSIASALVGLRSLQRPPVDQVPK